MHNITKHFQARMAQRGITAKLVEVTLELGEDAEGGSGQIVLNRRDATHLLREKQREVRDLERALSLERQTLRALKKIADKGGVAVVSANSALVTTYNVEPSNG